MEIVLSSIVLRYTCRITKQGRDSWTLVWENYLTRTGTRTRTRTSARTRTRTRTMRWQCEMWVLGLFLNHASPGPDSYIVHCRCQYAYILQPYQSYYVHTFLLCTVHLTFFTPERFLHTILGLSRIAAAASGLATRLAVSLSRTIPAC